MARENSKFLMFVQHPIKFKLFLFRKLPSAFFSGLQIKSIDASAAQVSIPYKWFTQNPFKSTYFACLAMAAEMSTGLLAMMNIYDNDTPVSMLVKGLQAEYYKKAKGLIIFTCSQGVEITECVNQAISTGEAQQIKVTSTGTDSRGEVVAKFIITWSFKMKTSTTPK